MKKPASKAQAKKPLDLLKNPWICVVSMILGIYIGHKWKNVGLIMALPGDLYLSLLKMSVMPIISTAIIAGLAKMLRGGFAGLYMKKMVVLFTITSLIGSGIGLLAGFIGQPGVNLGNVSEAFLGNALLSSTGSEAGHELPGIWNLIAQMVPANVFNAFSTGKVLSIIFASVMVGGAIGMNKSKTGERLLDVIMGTQEAFIKIQSWVLYGLPVGLACMMGGQVAPLGIDAVLALGKFVIVLYLAAVFLCLIYLLVMKIATGNSFANIFKAIRDPLFVSFSAASSVAPIPMALKSMEENLEQPREVVNLVIPLGVAMNRHSYALLFSLTAVFLAQLFGKQLDLGQSLLIFFTSALVGTAAAGRLAATIPMLTYVLAPLGVPVSVGSTIYLTVGAILDPIIQMSILFGSCANASIISNTKARITQKRFGTILLEKGFMTEEELEEALAMHRNMDKFGQFLQLNGYLTKKQLIEVLAEQQKMQ